MSLSYKHHRSIDVENIYHNILWRKLKMTYTHFLTHSDIHVNRALEQDMLINSTRVALQIHREWASNHTASWAGI